MWQLSSKFPYSYFLETLEVLKQNRDWLTKHSSPGESWFSLAQEKKPSAKAEEISRALPALLPSSP
jgi:hypothetical protein